MNNFWRGVVQGVDVCERQFYDVGLEDRILIATAWLARLNGELLAKIERVNQDRCGSDGEYAVAARAKLGIADPIA